MERTTFTALYSLLECLHRACPVCIQRRCLLALFSYSPSLLILFTASFSTYANSINYFCGPSYGCASFTAHGSDPHSVLFQASFILPLFGSSTRSLPSSIHWASYCLFSLLHSTSNRIPSSPMDHLNVDSHDILQLHQALLIMTHAFMITVLHLCAFISISACTFCLGFIPSILDSMPCHWSSTWWR